MKIRIAQIGLGPIGLETLKLAAGKPWAEIVGAVDIDPAKIGQDLGVLTRQKRLRGRQVWGSLEDLVHYEKPDLIFHTAVSRFKDAFAQIEPMARRGISVVSSCEELLFPRLREPRLAAKLDKVCKKSGARVIATGVNPGFVMDVPARLPDGRQPPSLGGSRPTRGKRLHPPRPVAEKDRQWPGA